MSNPFIGEIRLFGGNFAPLGWAACDGQLLSISEYDALFSLIGTMYGGDGQSTFALPDLRSRIPVHQGANPQTQRTYLTGQNGGAETTTLTVNNLPGHAHGFAVSSAAATSSAPGASSYLAATGGPILYANTANSPVTLNQNTIAPAGGAQPFSKLMPYQVLNFIISLQGIFPSQN